jgi:hypothetical protein
MSRSSSRIQSDITAEILREVPEDAVEFCQKLLAFEPTEYQVKLLRSNRQFIAARFCRQSGKTYTITARILHKLLRNPGSWWAGFGPSFRQSKQIIRKMTTFLLKLPKRWYHKPLKTKIELANGSRIEAFPNNPDTIRGPTLNGIYCDEFNFVANDEDLYDAILFTLGTTNGEFICSSTPWSRDHMFYKICKDKDFDDFKRFHVTWKEALEPKGPLKKNILEKIKKQLAADPWRWQREMEAEWAEDEDCWLSTSLITKCIDPQLEIREFDRQHSFWALELGPAPG